MAYYLTPKAVRHIPFVSYPERRRDKHRDLLVPFYRHGRWRGPRGRA